MRLGLFKEGAQARSEITISTLTGCLILNKGRRYALTCENSVHCAVQCQGALMLSYIYSTAAFLEASFSLIVALCELR